MYFRVFNNRTIVLNSGKVALDLLDSKSAIYSDRPIFWMGGELGGRNKSVFLTSFADPRFKIFRRLLQTGLNSRASKSYRPIQVEETRVLLQNLSTSPEDFMVHIRRYYLRRCMCSSHHSDICVKKRCSHYSQGCVRLSGGIK